MTVGARWVAAARHRRCHDGPVDPIDAPGPARSSRVGAGSLLLAGTDLHEPIFRRTVVYIIEHNDGGTLGVVLNRRTQTPIASGMADWTGLCSPDPVFRLGGPVRLESAICLGVLRPGVDAAADPGLTPIAGRVVMVDIDADPEPLGALLIGARVFVGYAGWTIGQLDGELDRDDWMVYDALDTDVLVPAGTDLWATVLRRQSPSRSILATHPIDLRRN